MLYPYLLALSFLISGTQNPTTVNPKSFKLLNEYVHFTNECVHGMLIVHRLLELYNQDINKYVDLEGYKLNDFGNADLPKDIFEDPEKWFFDDSPYKIYDRIVATSKGINIKHVKVLNAYCKQMKTICTQINNIRFEVDDQIKNNDLTNANNLQKVYDHLENGVDLYQSFFELQLKLEKKLNEAFLAKRKTLAKGSTIPELAKNMYIANNAVKKVLRALRIKDDKDFNTHVAFAKKRIQSVKSSLDSYAPRSNNSTLKSNKSKAVKKLDLAYESIRLFHETANVPTEYKLYGKFYYYHNSDIINKVNRYGNGYVKEFNDIIAQMNTPFLKLFEEPHFYQVIYPKKLEKAEHIKSSDDVVEVIPTKLKDREIVTNSRSIKVDSARFKIVLYDHLIQDGDIVSINFNGDWILEKYSLETASKELKIQLNETGKNYLLLHAESIGKRPPNTMAISYSYKGKKENIILKSDLNASELIEIEFDPSP